MKNFGILPLLLIVVSVDAIGFRLDPRGPVSSSRLAVTTKAVTEIMPLKDQFIQEVGRYVQHLQHHGKFKDFIHDGWDWTVSLLFTPDPGFRNADITASNLIYGVNEMYNWVEEEWEGNTLSTEGALILTGDCGRAIGTFEYMFHRIGRHNPELKRRMAINETLPQMSWTTGVAKAKATNVAKANTKSRDSILSGGLPPLVYMPNITLSTFRSSPGKNNASPAAPLCKRSELEETIKKNYICRGTDTLLSGIVLYRGQDLWSERGARLFVQDDGNLCLWHYPGGQPTMYWCWNHGKKFSHPDLMVGLTRDGKICIYNGRATGGYCTNNPAGPDDFQYRLTLQNDGNLVLYRGVFEKVMFSTNTAIFPYTGPTPCTARPINY